MNLPETATTDHSHVHQLEYNGHRILLIATAHVSRSSVELVKQVIDDVRPDAVGVELCSARYEAISNPDRWKQTDIIKVIKEGKIYLLFAQLVLGSFQKRIAQQFDITPGQELKQAIVSAKENGANIELIDRDVRTTLKRAWASESLWSLTKLFVSLLGSWISPEKSLTEDEIEKLKSSDILTSLTEELGKNLPGIKKAIIEERDLYLAEKIMQSNAKTIVAVVGAGHVPGIMRHVAEQSLADENTTSQRKIDIAALETLPKGRLSLKLIGYVLPAIISAFLIYGAFVMEFADFWRMFEIWILTTGTLAALGAAITLAHPLTILSAFLAAPITTLHPALAAGWVCGLVEAYLRKPTVSDFETLSDDMTSLKGLLRNRLLKIIMVTGFANLGASIGAIGGGWFIAQLVHTKAFG